MKDRLLEIYKENIKLVGDLRCKLQDNNVEMPDFSEFIGHTDRLSEVDSVTYSTEIQIEKCTTIEAVLIA